MKLIFPILGMALSAVATAVALVMCMAMGANSSAAQIRALKLWMGGFSLLGVAGIIGAIVLLRLSQAGWASGVAFLPTIAIMVIFLVAVLK